MAVGTTKVARQRPGDNDDEPPRGRRMRTKAGEGRGGGAVSSSYNNPSFVIIASLLFYIFSWPKETRRKIKSEL